MWWIMTLALAWCGDQPVELGLVSWQRDHAAGLAQARATGRPVLLLFQEVPG